MEITLGINTGNGYTKAVSGMTQSLMPSYFSEIRQGNIEDYQTFGQPGAILEILDSNNRKFKGTRWVVGEPVRDYFPTGFGSIVESQDGKIEYALPLLMASLGMLGVNELKATVRVAASIHDAKIHGESFIKAIHGSHVVKINNSSQPVLLDIKPKVSEEGVGAIATSPSYSNTSTNGLIDIGHGTCIASIYKGVQLVQDSRLVIPVGVHELCAAISRNVETRKQLGNYGNVDLIRMGLMNGCKYGTTDWNFNSVYEAELLPWLDTCLKPAFKHIKPRLERLDKVYLTGGGALLPQVSNLAIRNGLTALPFPQMAEAIGLYKAAVQIFGTANG